VFYNPPNETASVQTTKSTFIMKQTFLLALITGFLITSCSKSSNNNPTPTPTPTNTVTIDGTSYSTVTIGTQTWTAVNYNGTGGLNYGNSTTNIPANGKLYTLAEAQAITLPTGWRLPSSDDYKTLLTAVGSTQAVDGSYVVNASTIAKLLAKTSWSSLTGTNSSGFNVLAVGYNHHDTFQGSDSTAAFLTTSTLMEFNVPIPATFVISEYQFDYGSYVGFSDYVVATTDRASIRFIRSN
jgi:uncharacterized protein (TIGR02145 family)